MGALLANSGSKWSSALKTFSTDGLLGRVAVALGGPILVWGGTASEFEWAASVIVS
jgi:hypothetical protein